MKNVNTRLGKTIYRNLLLRVVILILTCFAVVYLTSSILGREMVFSLVVGIAVIFVQLKMLTEYILRINRSLVQFIDSGSYSEENDNMFKKDDSQISDFEIRVNQLKDDIGKTRYEGQKQKFLLKNAIDEMENGLVCLRNGSDVVFSNKAFRKLIDRDEIGSLSELKSINPKLGTSIEDFDPAMQGIVSINDFKASLRAKEFKIGNDNISLYSIQNIQQEIDKNEIEAWERLIKVLTHEIMNSLSPIISLSKSMQKSIEDPEKILSGLDTIENTGEGLINFISEYRKLSDLPPPARDIFKISNLLEHIRSLFKQECEERQIKLQINLKDQNLKLYADMFQIEQVLVNLITNAKDALSGQVNGIIKLSARSNSDTIEISVEDNGPGISLDIMDKIFIPFFSTKKKGTGIGLSLSKQIISNHAAAISISSDPGVSTKFIISLSNKNLLRRRPG